MRQRPAQRLPAALRASENHCLCVCTPGPCSQMALPATCGQLVHTATAQAMQNFLSAHNLFCAATPIYLAVLAWWRHLNRGGKAAQQRYGNGYGTCPQPSMCAESLWIAHVQIMRSRQGRYDRILRTLSFTSPAHRTLHNALQYWWVDGSFTGHKRRHSGRLVHPAYTSQHAQPRFISFLHRFARAACMGRFPKGLSLQARKAAALGRIQSLYLGPLRTI